MIIRYLDFKGINLVLSGIMSTYKYKFLGSQMVTITASNNKANIIHHFLLYTIPNNAPSSIFSLTFHPVRYNFLLKYTLHPIYTTRLPHSVPRIPRIPTPFSRPN